MKTIKTIFVFSLLLFCLNNVSAQKSDDLVYKKDKIRLIVTSDIGGTDPDDKQSMIHFLVYTDVFDVEGIISAPWGNGRLKHILECIDAYEQDYPNLMTWSDFPNPNSLRAVSKQGAILEAPSQGYSEPTDGSKWIIECARRPDPRPLYIAVWGAIDDVAQALHDAPDIIDSIRVYWIAGPNRKRKGKPVFNSVIYMEENFKTLWWIQADQTYRGMFNGGNMRGDLSNSGFPKKHVWRHGALGEYFNKIRKSELKMGDTPSILYYLNNDVTDPAKDGWGGAFVPYGNGTNWWRDNKDPSVKHGGYNGAKTVNKWREEFLRHWQNRMDWCQKANPNQTALAKYTGNSKQSLVHVSYGNGFLNITNLYLSNNTAQGELFDMSGASVLKFNLEPNTNNHRVNLQDVQPGTYIVKIQGASLNFSGKLIKITQIQD